MQNVKSVMPVQIPGSGWCVRVRFADRTEEFIPAAGEAPYLLAQAQLCASNESARLVRMGHKISR